MRPVVVWIRTKQLNTSRSYAPEADIPVTYGPKYGRNRSKECKTFCFQDSVQEKTEDVKTGRELTDNEFVKSFYSMIFTSINRVFHIRCNFYVNVYMG